ncbi:hypothetical protein [Streptomyces sp. NPDC052042]|uniref:hypothetical protein n=1 Tax=Streptomyces sp. NPDC052042 TaxID=3365683 RepID=UPI0037D7077A
MSVTIEAPAAHEDQTRELGRRLQLTRAGIWFAGNQGDPYAMILRATDADSTPWEERIRAHVPWFRSDLLDAWVTADHAVADRVLADPRFGTLDRAGRRPHADLLPVAAAFPQYERTTFARLRGLAAPVLSDTVLGGSERADGEGLIHGLLPADPAGFDLVADVARPYAAAFVLRLLGVGEGERAEAARLLARCGPQLDARFTPQTLAVARDSAAAVQEVAALVRELVARKATAGAARPADVIGTLLSRGVARQDVERIGLVLAVGAPEPAATLIANTVRGLLGRSGDWANARHASAASAAVDRTLLVRPPARLEHRVAHEDVRFGGRDIHADDQVVVLASAVPGAPRHASRTWPLGGPDGPHLALAWPVVRLAAWTAVSALADALPGLGVTGRVLMRPRSPVVRAYARFPVRER